jgi:hypothetical protein
MEGLENWEKPIFLPGLSFCHPSAGFRTASQSVAVSRSDLKIGSGKTFEPFVPFRGNSVIVNPHDKPGCQTIKLGLPRRLVRRSGPGEGGSLCCESGSNRCAPSSWWPNLWKYFKMNGLHTNLHSGGQTQSNRVKPVFWR